MKWQNHTIQTNTETEMLHVIKTTEDTNLYTYSIKKCF